MRRLQRFHVGLILGLITIGLLVATGTTPRVSAEGAGYVSLNAPMRILDTRPDGSTADGEFARVGQRPTDSTLRLPVAGRVGVAGDAVAVVLNVTVTDAHGPGFIAAYPCGQPQPTASNLNYVAGRNIPNLVVAKLGDGGSVCLYNTEPVQLIVDVTGFFPGSDAYSPLATPARLLDTRASGTTIDGLLAMGGIRPSGSVLSVGVTNRAGVPSDAVTAVLNVTVDGPLDAGFVTVFPCGTGIPTASNLNYVRGQTVANSVFARVGAGGAVCVYTSSSTHVIVDIAGYFGNDSTVVPLAAPARILDTRSTGVTADGASARTGLRPNGGTIWLSVAGRAGVPAGASAVILNVTVDGPQSDGFATVYPAGGGRPNASNVNYVAGQSTPNAVTARLGSGGTLCVFTSGAAHLIVDVAGYIVGPAPASIGTTCPADPVVVVPVVTPVTPVVTPAAPVVTSPPVAAPVVCGAGYYVNVDGKCVQSPVSAPSVPAGATAVCRDGTYSFSLHRSGTCSHHGGVARWL